MEILHEDRTNARGTCIRFHDEPFLKSGSDKTGASIKAFLRALKAASVIGVQKNTTPLSKRSVTGLLITPKFLTNFL